jgi:hypothetical protein
VDEIAELLRRSIDIQQRIVRIGRHEQRKAMLTDFDMGIVVCIRTGHVDARQINSDVRHVLTVAEEVYETR